MKGIHVRIGSAAMLWVLLAGPGLCLGELDLVERAKKDPALNVHMGPPAYGELMVDAFAKRFPFVKIRKSVDAPFGQPLTGDYFKKTAPFLDVEMGCQEPAIVTEWMNAGFLATLDALPNWKMRPIHLEDDPHYVYFLGAPHTLIYNSAVLNENELPRSYDELTISKWKGKVVLRNPTKGNSPGFLAEFINSTRKGLDWYSAMGRNQAMVVDNSSMTLSVLRKGERPIALSRDIDHLLGAEGSDAKNKNLKIYFMADELPYQYQFASMNTRAPHPAAARLFMNWLLSAEAVKVLEDQGYSVGSRQREHLKHPKTWQMDISRFYKTHAAVTKEAAERLMAGGAVKVGGDLSAKKP